MSALPIDFAPPRPGLHLRRTPGWAWAAGLLGLALCLNAAHAWQIRHQATEQLRLDVARQAARLRIAAQNAADRQRIEAAAQPSPQAALAVIRPLNTPWGAMLNALERANLPAMALLELLPDVRSGRIRGVAEARHSAAMLAYVQALKEQPEFGAAWLRSHTLADPEGGGTALRFEFELEWPEGAR